LFSRTLIPIDQRTSASDGLSGVPSAKDRLQRILSHR
jgi:hypothetical protein